MADRSQACIGRGARQLSSVAELTSQLPVARRHEQIGAPTLADGMFDRLVHNAHRIEMRGESMRKKRNPPRDESDEKEGMSCIELDLADSLDRAPCVGHGKNPHQRRSLARHVEVTGPIGVLSVMAILRQLQRATFVYLRRQSGLLRILLVET